MSINAQKISVITVTYNCVGVVEDTIRNVLSQTYPNIEYIVIDGGSTDGTCEVVRRYADRLSCWISEPDKGIYDAMNKGIRMATGEWISFMNAGDLFASADTIEKVFAGKVYGNEVGVVHGDFILKYRWGNVYKRGLDNGKFRFCHQAEFVRMSCHKTNPFDINHTIAADRKVLNEICSQGYRKEYVNIPIAIYQADTGVSSQNRLRLYMENHKAIGDADDMHYRMRCMYLWVCTKMYMVLPKKLLYMWWRHNARRRNELMDV